MGYIYKTERGEYDLAKMTPEELKRLESVLVDKHCDTLKDLNAVQLEIRTRTEHAHDERGWQPK